MTLNLYSQQDIARILEALSVASEGTAAQADEMARDGTTLRADRRERDEAMLIYQRGYTDALSAVAIALGIVYTVGARRLPSVRDLEAGPWAYE